VSYFTHSPEFFELNDGVRADLGVYSRDAHDAALDIELDLLPDLSDADLKELGLSLGQRRRLLRAVIEVSELRPEMFL